MPKRFDAQVGAPLLPSTATSKRSQRQIAISSFLLRPRSTTALLMIGVAPDGTKELITAEDGCRESAESWRTVLRDLKRRGMRPPVVAVGDGALGFWAAVRDVWPKTREQRDWLHKLGKHPR